MLINVIMVCTLCGCHHSGLSYFVFFASCDSWSRFIYVCLNVIKCTIRISHVSIKSDILRLSHWMDPTVTHSTFHHFYHEPHIAHQNLGLGGSVIVINKACGSQGNFGVRPFLAVELCSDTLCLCYWDGPENGNTNIAQRTSWQT